MFHLVSNKDKILLSQARKVRDFNVPELVRIFNAMEKVMTDRDGVGIAATQLGINKALAIVKLLNNDLVFMVNPVIMEQSGKHESMEGCLSFPDRDHINVTRPMRLVVQYQTVEGVVKSLAVNDKHMCARICHEIDHLDGLVIYDYSKIEGRPLDNYLKLREGVEYTSDIRREELSKKLQLQVSKFNKLRRR